MRSHLADQCTLRGGRGRSRSGASLFKSSGSRGKKGNEGAFADSFGRVSRKRKKKKERARGGCSNAREPRGKRKGETPGRRLNRRVPYWDTTLRRRKMTPSGHLLQRQEGGVRHSVSHRQFRPIEGKKKGRPPRVGSFRSRPVGRGGKKKRRGPSLTIVLRILARVRGREEREAELG